MSEIVSIIESSLSNDVTSLETISRNLSNSSTVAYKREISVRNFEDSLRANVEDSALPTVNVFQDLSQGALKETGSELDLAIDGAAFFVLQGKNGEEFTRNGTFGVSPDGYLTGPDGRFVLGESGAVQVGFEAFEVGYDGSVTREDEIISKLRLAIFNGAEAPEYIGQGVYRSTDMSEDLSNESRVLQGYRETSNVNAMADIIAMMETTRHFETGHVVLKSYDSMLDTAINEIGDI